VVAREAPANEIEAEPLEAANRIRVKREQHNSFNVLLPDSQGRNPALTVF
jgi:hypothetical protein